MMEPNRSLVMQGIAKAYPGVVALENAGFEAFAGEALAVMGANGAGKSTLMNILGGEVQRDRGVITLAGHPIDPASPREAAALGIAFVHQELTMLPTMTVAENIFIDAFPLRHGLIDRAIMNTQAAGLLSRLGATIEPEQIVEALSTGDRQMVEIARALRRNPSVIIFDEPTSSLTQPEKDSLFRVIRGLKRDGAVVLYITHFIEEIFEICDRVTVLRSGRTVGGGAISGMTSDAVLRLMLGDVVTTSAKSQSRPPSRDVALEVRGLTRRPLLNEISFDIGAGEVVGIWGLLGSGRTELMRALTGLDSISAGTIRWRTEGSLTPITPRALHALAGFVTEDRRGEGLLLPRSVEDNIALPSLSRLTSRFGFIDRQQQATLATSMITQLGIKVAGRKQAVSTLSGGNQQKVVLGRWLACGPKLYLLDEPTRGLDVNAKAELLSLALKLAREGASVLIVCSELDELMRVCDRYLVMVRGRIVATLPGSADSASLMSALSPSTAVMEAVS